MSLLIGVFDPGPSWQSVSGNDVTVAGKRVCFHLEGRKLHRDRNDDNLSAGINRPEEAAEDLADLIEQAHLTRSTDQQQGYGNQDIEER